MFLGVCTRGGLTLVQGQGASFWLRIVCRGLKQRQKSTWFHAGTETQAQECLWGFEQGQDPA